MTATAADWIILLSAGILAACASTFLDLRIKGVPGHAILRVVLPMSLGLALVPRRGAGCTMATTAFLTGVLLHVAGFKGEGLGIGALTSLTATGPLLDLTLRRVHGGWKQYAAFTLAGLASNLIALFVRGGAKWMGWEAGRGLWDWFGQAWYTYILCGLLAGFISGLILFYGRSRTEPLSEDSAP
jgi:hypothetical protein